MGQAQSQQPTARQPTEPEISDEERAQNQAEYKMRARQQAALDKRLANQPKKSSSSAAAPAKKTRSALEQASKENVGWRNADAQAEFRNWN